LRLKTAPNALQQAAKYGERDGRPIIAALEFWHVARRKRDGDANQNDCDTKKFGARQFCAEPKPLDQNGETAE